MDDFWESLLCQARSGTMLTPPVGALGSAGWRRGDPAPKTLILCDLQTPLTHLQPFPEEFGAVEELDLSGNALDSLPENIKMLTNLRCLFLGGFNEESEDGASRKNRLVLLPSLASLAKLQHLSVHDTDLKALPDLPPSLQTLRVDRCPLESLHPDALPTSLTTLHLEGCPLPGTLERPNLLPEAVKRLEHLEDLQVDSTIYLRSRFAVPGTDTACQLPDGSHVGLFFGAPLPEMLRAAA